MKSSQWIIKFFIITFFFLLLMGIVNFIIDPMQHYRKAQFYKPRYVNERYLNPGLAKNYDYKQVIIGSSMTENFILSDATSILGFNKPIKFCMSGTSAYEMRIMLENAFKYQDIDTVLYGLDFFSFIGKTTRLFNGDGSIPMYLYDDNLLNDYRYLLNFDTFKFTLDSIIESKMKKHEPKFDYNRMYQWQHTFSHSDFNGSKLIKQWNQKNSDYKKDYNNKKYALEVLTRNADVNLKTIIHENPDKIFYIFYPPYSILAFKDMYSQGYLDSILRFKTYVFMSLLKYSNVKIYDFQVAEEITCNLNNYRDLTHYHQRINTWMLEQIKEENYLVKDLNTLKSFNEMLLEQVKGCEF